MVDDEGSNCDDGFFFTKNPGRQGGKGDSILTFGNITSASIDFLGINRPSSHTLISTIQRTLISHHHCTTLKMSSESRYPTRKRLSSSAQQPVPGLEMPERLKKGVHAGNNPMVKPGQESLWTARLQAVQACSQAEYKGGNGLQDVWVAEGQKLGSRCVLMCDHPDPQTLQVVIRTQAKKDDPDPKLLFNCTVSASADVQMSIKAYEVTRSIQFERASLDKNERSIWKIYFAVEDPHIKNSKRAMHRLMNIAGLMSQDAVPYTNVARKAEPDAGSIRFEYAGGIRFELTKHLATPNYQQLMGKDVETVEEEDTRKGATHTRNYLAAKRLDRATAREAKGTRLTIPDKKALNKARKSGRRQTVLEKRYRGGSVATASQEVDDRQAGESSDPASQQTASGSQSSFAINGLLEHKQGDDGLEFLVDWDGWDPTWQPARNVSDESVREYWASKSIAAPASSSAGPSNLGRRRSDRRRR